MEEDGMSFCWFPVTLGKKLIKKANKGKQS